RRLLRPRLYIDGHAARSTQAAISDADLQSVRTAKVERATVKQVGQRRVQLVDAAGQRHRAAGIAGERQRAVFDAKLYGLGPTVRVANDDAGDGAVYVHEGGLGDRHGERRSVLDDECAEDIFVFGIGVAFVRGAVAAKGRGPARRGGGTVVDEDRPAL